MMSNIPAGWYEDPTHGLQVRYWDGAAWTTHVAPNPAITPAPTAAAAVPAPAAPVAVEPAPIPQPVAPVAQPAAPEPASPVPAPAPVVPAGPVAPQREANPIPGPVAPSSAPAHDPAPSAPSSPAPASVPSAHTAPSAPAGEVQLENTGLPGVTYGDEPVELDRKARREAARAEKAAAKEAARAAKAAKKSQGSPEAPQEGVKQPKGKKKRVWLSVLITVAIVASLGGGTAYVWLTYFSNPNPDFVLPSPPPLPPTQAPELPGDEVDDPTFEGDSDGEGELKHPAIDLIDKAKEVTGEEVYYETCDDVAANENVRRLIAGMPGFRAELDTDNNGIACDEEQTP